MKKEIQQSQEIIQAEQANQANKVQTPKKRKAKQVIPAQEKCRAVLSVWTESRSISSICRELSATRAQVMRWQEIAMEAMLKALDQTPRKVKKQVLSSRLEKLLGGKKRQQSPPPGTNGKT